MRLFYIEEHSDCYVYNNQDGSVICFLEKEQGEKISLGNTHNELLFLLKGKIKCSFEYQVDKTFEEGDFLLLPREANYTVEAEEKSQLVIVRMHPEINFCDRFPLTMLFELNSNHKKAANGFLFHSLTTNKIIDDWLKSIVNSVSAGLRCTYFQELKQKEILYYLRASYSKEDLFAFFSPILNSDTAFSNLIHQNYASIKTLDELAKITNYSMSGFKRKFKKVFSTSPAMWIEHKKAKKIYHEINCTSKSFKEIAVEYDFSSPAHFDRFCRKMYNLSPGSLRKNTKNSVLSMNEPKH